MPSDSERFGEIEKLRQDFAISKEATTVKLESLQKQLDQTKAIAALELEVKTELGRLKWLGAAATIAVVVAGTAATVIGYRSVDDYVKVVKEAFSARLDQISSFYYDFSKGNALLNANKASDAVPYLKRCFLKYPYDESVIIPLLDAIAGSDDISQGSEVIRRLQLEPANFGKLKSPDTHINIARVQLRAALDSAQASDQAVQSLRLAQRLANNDDDEAQKTIFVDLWLCQIARHDFTEAQRMIDLL